MGSGSSRGGSAGSTKSFKKGSSAVPKPVPKPIAFEVDFSECSSKAAAKPKRIQELEHGDASSKLTAEQIEDKLRLAEENRQKNLARVRQLSRQSARPRKPAGTGVR